MKSKVASICNWRDKIAQKNRGALQHADEDHGLTGVIAVDLGAHFSHTLGDLFAREIRTFSSAMAIHIKLKQLAIGTWQFSQCSACGRGSERRIANC